jgi:cytochrome c-type biogenesis protein CcmH/NrfG
MARTKRKDGPGTVTSTSAKSTKRKQEAPYSVTPTMNERLRGHFKWVFALLAVIFALMFVIAGVGTSGPSVLDMIKNSAGSSDAPAKTVTNTAVKDALAKTKSSPQDPQAWLALAQAYVNTGSPEKVPAAAAKASELASKDAAVQGAVADVYLAEAAAALQTAQTEYAAAQAQGNVAGRPAVPQTVIPGQSNGATPFQTAQESISSAVMQDASAKVTPLQTEATDAYKAAVTAQTIVTELKPNDPAAWFRLGQISSAANDSVAAIDAYKMFVKLAPDDPLTPKVKEEIARLEKANAALPITN